MKLQYLIGSIIMSYIMYYEYKNIRLLYNTYHSFILSLYYIIC